MLYAVSDLHVGFEANRRMWEELPDHPEGWLVPAGELGETEAHLRFAQIATARFRRAIWVPGDHELWTLPGAPCGLRGEARYLRWVELCRDHGVLTPEDPYVVWPGAGPRCADHPCEVLPVTPELRPSAPPASRRVGPAAEGARGR